MPTVNLNKKTVFELLGKKYSDEELKDKIPMIGVGLDSIDTNYINVEIFPNRPDLLSEQGFARALSSFFGIKKGIRRYTTTKSDYKVFVDKSVKNVRPFTACGVVKNIKFDDEKIKEVIQIQEKLHITYGRNRKKCAIGIYPLEKIRFPIKYTAKSPEEIFFMPLESNKKMNGNEILKNHPTGKQYAHLLDGKKVFPIFIDANNEILSIPPIINSETVGKITENTRDVFIEVSGFDFEYLSKCLNMIVTAFIDMGGVAYEIKIIYGEHNKEKRTELDFKNTSITPNFDNEKIKIDINYINKILGLKLKENELKGLLEKMGFEYSNKTVIIPCYRCDIIHQIDIVEDVAIAYGYNNFEGIIPKVATIGEENRFEVFKNKVRNCLTNIGLIEVKNVSLTNKKIQQELSCYNIEVVELANSFSEEHNILRAWLTPSLLKNLQDNKANEYPQNIFEIGTVFVKEDNNSKDNNNPTGVSEFDRLCICLASKDSDFTKVRQVVDYLMRSFGIEYDISEVQHTTFIEGRVGRISVDKKEIAYIGEIHPKVLNNFELTTPVSCLELNLTELYKKI
ncbi:MAG: phenylalanine--tRNA ligase subunit beta [Candidatus Woesearchaeota archaeon]